MIEFQPTHTLFLLTNHRPVIPPHEYAMWERVDLIEFKFSYVDEPKRPNERKRDPYLPEKLKAEASGILAWLVKGCLEWQRIGLNPPAEVKAATSKYREDEDMVGHFLEERTYRDPMAKVQASVLYNAYRKWCEDYGYLPLGGKKFWQRIEERFRKDRRGEGNFYFGLALIQENRIETFEDHGRYYNSII